jgi:hypothetical protein
LTHKYYNLFNHISVGGKSKEAVHCASVLAKKIKTERVEKAKAAGKPLSKVNVKSLIEKHDCCSSTKGYFF